MLHRGHAVKSSSGLRTFAAGIVTALAAAILTVPPANAAPKFCTYDFPVAPPNARCVNYNNFGNLDGGYCWLNLPAYTPDGRAVPSSCDYYDNTPPGVGRPPNPQMVPPAATPTRPSADPAPAPSASAPAPVPPPLPAANTSDKTGSSTGGTGKLVGVRLARNNGYDRIVLEFADGLPAYKIGYRPLPAYADPSGKEILLPGASESVHVTLTGATGNGGGPDGVQTYFGPSTVTADTTVVTEAKAAGDFEAVLSWVVGLRSKVPFRVTTLTGPPRLAIDFEH